MMSCRFVDLREVLLTWHQSKVSLNETQVAASI